MSFDWFVFVKGTLHQKNVGVVGKFDKLAYAYTCEGRKSDARGLLAELRERAKTSYVSPTYIAMTYAALEETERAFEWLRRACDDRAILLPALLNADPRLDHLRADPRFSELLRRVGLAS